MLSRGTWRGREGLTPPRAVPSPALGRHRQQADGCDYSPLLVRLDPATAACFGPPRTGKMSTNLRGLRGSH